MIRTRLALAAGLLLLATRAHAQLPSTYSGANVTPVNGHVFGAYVPITSNSIGAIAQLRLSFLPSVDFGFQGGLTRLDQSAGSRTLIRVGGDVKFLLSPASPERPVDLALGGGLGIYAGDDYNVLSLGPTLTASRTWTSGSTSFTPYAGIGLAITTINAGPFDDNEFSLPLRVGVELGISPAARLVGEFTNRIASDFGDDTDFVLGVNLPF